MTAEPVLVYRIRILAIAAASIVCVACSKEVAVQDSQKAEPADAGQVVVYSTHGADIVKPVFDAYTAETGVKVFLVSGDFQDLAEKIHRTGRGPVADLFIADNGADLWHAAEQNLFRPIRSAVIIERLPQQLRDPEHLWVAFATRARTVIFNTDLASDAELKSIVDYASLTEEPWRDRLCLSSSKIAGNGSLIAMLISDKGVRAAELIVRGWRSNLAAPVFSDDGNLLQAVAAGRCVIGIADSSELARFLRENADAKVAPFWFSDPGVLHVNATGGGVTRHAQNPELAASLLEWLTSAAANALFAALTLEFPANPGSVTDDSIAAWAGFEANPLHLTDLGFLQEDAVKLAQRARYP